MAKAISHFIEFPQYDEQLVQILQKSEYEIVYHYTSFNGVKGIVENKQIYMSDVKFLNDYDELNYGITLFYEVVGKNKNKSSLCRFICDYLPQLGKRNFRFDDIEHDHCNIYILSCSIDNNVKEMWNYYTKNTLGLGYCVGFNPKNFINVSDGNFLIEGNIIYDRQEQEQIFKNLIGNYEHDFEKYDKKIFINYFFNIVLKLSLFMKNSLFANEKEYRLVILSDKETRQELAFVDYYSILKPCLKAPIYVSNLKEVYISPYNKSDLANVGLKKFLEYYGLNLKIKNAIITVRS